MNTINGNFIERVIPNIKNATLNLLIGDQLATMNLADFQAAIAPSYISSKGLKMKDNLPLDATLNNVVDSSDVITISPLQLSTTQVAVLGAVLGTSGGKVTLGAYDATQGGIWFGTATPTSSNVALSGNGSINYLNYGSTLYFTVNGGAVSRMHSNGDFSIGTLSASARLHVRGDGTNLIARFENSAGTSTHIFKDTTALEFGSQGIYISATANGTSTSTSGRGFLFSGISGQGIHQFNFSSSNGETSGTVGGINLTGSYGVASGNALYQPLRIAYTINNIGAVTGTATGLFLNATETALNGMTHNLMDLQVGGSSKFRVNNVGRLDLSGLISTASSTIELFGGEVRIIRTGNGRLLLSDSSATTFDRLQLGGTTSSFPAIKRNGAAIDFRLADDSGLTDIFCRSIANNEVDFFKIKTDYGIYGQSITGSAKFMDCYTDRAYFGTGTTNASARLQIDSTTKGFLMPRMTQAQILLIATPANGLMVYNTDINTPCFYDGGAAVWKKVSHSNM